MTRTSVRTDLRSGQGAVLWIDDRPDVALLTYLRLEDFGVTSVGTGAAGLEHARAGTYDVIVVDLYLPDIHGLTVVERVRADGILAPVLVVTGHYLDPETESHALAAGATAFKYKPFWGDEVAVLLRDLLNGIRRLSLPDPAAAAAAPANWFVENPVRGKLLIVRVLPTLDRLAARPDTSHDQACLVEQHVGAILTGLSDAGLPLTCFIAFANALKLALNPRRDIPIGRLAAAAAEALREAIRHPPELARDSRVRQALDLLLARPHWWPEEDLANAVAISRSRFAHLLREELSIDYEILRRLIVMRAAVRQVLNTEEQFAQIAHSLAMHPGTFDHVCNQTFGLSPRALRHLWKRLRRVTEFPDAATGNAPCVGSVSGRT